ncbi:fuculose phosphate aldolase [Methanosarcinales archaeon ex4484_138]|nr:MAG: fuculose phosphate aldolase [Methanosarcinales archaeon ex4484_138]RLG26385.1 MAG: fuculose phosphate aldolase [Methanosarcinales archaeon]HHI30574.1 aldolase [Candidatus Methanoperedenaceae archaeon]
MWQEISRFGKKLVASGLVESHFGNISLKIGSKMLITRSGIALDDITENGVVEIDLNTPSSLDIIASSETIVHRAIYKNTSALAIIHAHAPYAVIQSFIEKTESLKPIDSEGQYFLHEIPIVRGGVGTPELSQNTATALREHRGVIVYSHGTFATGKILEEAFVTTTQIEHSCKIKYFVELQQQKTV